RCGACAPRYLFPAVPLRHRATAHRAGCVCPFACSPDKDRLLTHPILHTGEVIGSIPPAPTRDYLTNQRLSHFWRAQRLATRGRTRQEHALTIWAKSGDFVHTALRVKIALSPDPSSKSLHRLKRTVAPAAQHIARRTLPRQSSRAHMPGISS